MVKLTDAYGNLLLCTIVERRELLSEVNGIQEILANAAIACHFNDSGYHIVHELLMQMKKCGMNLWGELYPYNAGNTTLNAHFFLVKQVWSISSAR